MLFPTILFVLFTFRIRIVRNLETETLNELDKNVNKYDAVELANNEKKEGTMIPITSTTKLEKVFLDICGPFPRSGAVSYTHLPV